MDSKFETKEEVKQSKTSEVIKNLSDVVTDTLEKAQDIATAEVMLPVDTRVQHRLETIRNLSAAVSRKIMGQWKTTPPKMYISKINVKKLSNTETEITFYVYDMDDKGNKKVVENNTIVTLANGDKVERNTSSEYVLRYLVRERIMYGKPIEREKIDLTK